jgi:hypothetical protein
MKQRLPILSVITPLVILATNLAFAQSSSLIAQQQFSQQPLNSILASKKMVVESDYALQLENADLQKRSLEALAGLSQDLHFAMSSYLTPTQPQVQVNNIQITLSPGHVQYQNVGLGVGFQASQVTALVSIGEIKVDRIVEQDLGGVIARIQVTASCHGVSLQFADPAAMASASMSPLVSADLLQLHVDAAQIQIGSPTVQMSALSCDGAQGFEELIRAEVTRVMSDTQVVSSFIHDQYIQKIQQVAAGVHYKWNDPKKVFSDSKLEAWIYPQSIAYIPELNSWVNQGHLQMIPVGATQKSSKIYRFQNADVLASLAGQGTSLLLPESFILEVIGQYFNQESFSVIKRSTEILGFQTLMGSFFAKLFLWPDLLFFSKSTPFLFIGQLSQQPQVAWSGKDLQLQIHLPLTVDMRYEEESKYLPFVLFNVPTTVTAPVSIAGEQLALQFQNVSMNLSYQYDPSYCETQANSCGSISRTTLRQALKDLVNGQSYKIPIPQIDIFSGVMVKSTGMVRDAAAGTVLFRLQ